MSEAAQPTRSSPSVAPRSPAQKLVRGVLFRLQIDAVVRSTLSWFFGLALLFGVGLLASRFSGYLVGVFNLWSAAIVPVLAFLCAWFWHRRVTEVMAARCIDRSRQTKDLFLAMVLLDQAVGDYKPIVSHSAEELAVGVHPPMIVQFQWGHPFRSLALVVAVVMICFFVLPQWDPFGRIQASVATQAEQQELRRMDQETQLRMAEIKRQEEQGVEAKQIGKELESLKQAIRAAKPSEPQKNMEALASRQKALGDQWRKMNAERMKSMLSKGVSPQEFGQESPKIRKWSQELAEGKTDSLKKEIQEVKDLLKEMAAVKDPARKAELEQQVKRKLRDLHEFAKNKATEQKLANALERAMKQLKMEGKSEQMSQEAREMMEKSMDLSQQELEQLSKNAQQMKEVEKAMEVAQMARQLNQKQKLDGQACEQCQAMEDYEALFKELMAQLGGDGLGQGGEGQGEGKKAEEDESSKTKFKTETASSPITAGKMLMSLKSQGKGEKGEAKERYQDLVKSVKQGVSEAIQQEQVPPGYHESIKSYFDDLGDGGKP